MVARLVPLRSAEQMSKLELMLAACAGAASVNTAPRAAAAAKTKGRTVIIVWPLPLRRFLWIHQAAAMATVATARVNKIGRAHV